MNYQQCHELFQTCGRRKCDESQPIKGELKQKRSRSILPIYFVLFQFSLGNYQYVGRSTSKVTAQHHMRIRLNKKTPTSSSSIIVILYIHFSSPGQKSKEMDFHLQSHIIYQLQLNTHCKSLVDYPTWVPTPTTQQCPPDWISIFSRSSPLHRRSSLLNNLFYARKR